MATSDNPMTRPRPRGGRPAEAGYTLIEMLTVMGIFGLISAMVFPAWMNPLQRAQLVEVRTALVSNLRLARALAVHEDRPVRFDLSADGRAYRWERSWVMLPPTVAMESRPQSITFFHDGSSSGGELKLIEHAWRARVAVDPTTGLTSAG
jgi:prepilin-type N-terminal cleavage/methylation domain-containing protein